MCGRFGENGLAVAGVFSVFDVKLQNPATGTKIFILLLDIPKTNRNGL